MTRDVELTAAAQGDEAFDLLKSRAKSSLETAIELESA
jgi:hypothetical protein